MEEENNNKYHHSLKEHFPGIFNFFKSQLPDQIWEEWWGDLEENIQKKTKEQKWVKWSIKILYLLEILPIFHSAREMGYLRWEKLRRQDELQGQENFKDKTKRKQDKERTEKETEAYRKKNREAYEAFDKYVRSLDKVEWEEILSPALVNRGMIIRECDR